MKPSSTLRSLFLAGLLAVLAAAPLVAVEVVTEEDLIEGVVTEDQLVRVADNAIFLFDSSSSMNDEFQARGKSGLELVKSEVKKRMGYFPDIGLNFGLYLYTPWKELYPVQPFDREKVIAALDKIPTKGSGPTRLSKSLDRLKPILKPLSGRTVVFILSDGGYTGSRPASKAMEIANLYDVCFYMISTAESKKDKATLKSVADQNACSRVIPLENFLDYPAYTSGALYDVIATEEIVTVSAKRIVGLEVDDIGFGFDKTEPDAKDKSELDELGEFMSENPGTYAVIAGYTDNTGPEDYNEGLSRRRTEAIRSYLTEKHGIDASRFVLQWYGSDNPLVSNDTREGRATNRRVEIAVGGL